MHAHGPPFRPENPDDAHAELHILTRFVVDILGLIARGNDFDRDVRWNLPRSLGNTCLRDTLPSDERNIGNAHGVRPTAEEIPHIVTEHESTTLLGSEYKQQ